MRRFFRFVFALTIALIVHPLGGAFASDSSEKRARVTQIVREVNLLPSATSPRPAAVNDQVNEGTSVRTGDASRSELTFKDLTIDRLGANTIFSFNKAGRSIDLASGSLLLRVPKDSGGAGIKNPAVTVAITGTTLILEAARGGRSRLIVLEGTARLSLTQHRDQTTAVRAGQMLEVPAGATTLPPPVDTNLDQVMKTHPLLTEFPPLPSRDLIVAVIEQQRTNGSAGDPIYQGRPVTGGGSGLRLPPLVSTNPNKPKAEATPAKRKRKAQQQDTIR